MQLTDYQLAVIAIQLLSKTRTSDDGRLHCVAKLPTKAFGAWPRDRFILAGPTLQLGLEDSHVLCSQIHVDLPSEETERTPRFVEKVRSRFGRPTDLRTGKEQLTMQCGEVVAAIMACFHRANICDVMSLVVDDSALFVDVEGKDDDAPELLEAARRHTRRSPQFGELQLAAEHHIDGLHIVIEVRVLGSVQVGERELQILFSARPEENVHRPGESAESYANRLIAFAGGDALQSAIQTLERLTSNVGRQFQDQIGICAVVQGAVEVMLVHPNADEIKNISDVDFATLAGHTYVPLPATVHPDNYNRYFADPLYDFQNLILIGEVLEHRAWATAQLVLLEEDGSLWGTGDALETCDLARWQQLPQFLYCLDGTLLLAELASVA
tara:strand:+ start:61208 stop:62356 length:1149 start_codon:yes stop_codon:yes gene_type:complete